MGQTIHAMEELAVNRLSESGRLGRGFMPRCVHVRDGMAYIVGECLVADSKIKKYWFGEFLTGEVITKPAPPEGLVEISFGYLDTYFYRGHTWHMFWAAFGKPGNANSDAHTT